MTSPVSALANTISIETEQNGGWAHSLDHRIGIVANGGKLPVAVAHMARDRGHDVFILGIMELADRGIEAFPHAYVHLGQLGRLFRTLHENNCRQVVLVGSLRRPNLWAQRFDTGFMYHLPRLLRMMRGGDDSVLRRVALFFESQGFEVVPAHELAPQLLAPDGVFSRAQPDAQALGDAMAGFRVVEALGKLDVGQAAVVVNGHVLAVEAAEGTDAMLVRCASLDRHRRRRPIGVLVKAPKPGQDLRLDMPTIGPRTVQLAAEAGLAGIAVTAGAVLIAGPAELVESADSHGIFLYGAAKADKG